MSSFEGQDTEVSTAFQPRSAMQSVINTAMLQANALKAAGGTNTTQYVMEMDRSDDEESDHTPDPYTSQIRGRVSPSPYTANTERARQFNSYVRGVIEHKLDILIPISHQPRDLITEIIADASVKFPEFASCVRKRIRTFLKSYRRSRKLRDVVTPTTNGITKTDSTNHSPIPDHTPQGSTSNTAVVTIITDTPHSNEDDPLPPEPKKVRLSPNSLQTHSKPFIPSGIMAAAAAAGSSQNLSSQEVLAVRQLITGYRESAGFLQRAADQLEVMLQNNSS